MVAREVARLLTAICTHDRDLESHTPHSFSLLDACTMSRPSQSTSSKMKPSSVSLSGLRSGLLSASKQLKGTYQNVAQSVAVVQANRAGDGPKGSFIGQVKDQIVHDRSKRREEEERGTQRLALFPGWAVRRFELGEKSTGEGP